MAFSKAALKSFETELSIYTGKMLPEQAREALKAGVRESRARVEAEQAARSGGITPDVVTIIDGVRGAQLSAIQPNSAILLDWNYLQEAVATVVAYLRKHGPVVKGDWKKAIVVDVDGRFVDPMGGVPPTAKEAFVYVNIVYARRLEVGKNADGTPFVVQVPYHFVEEAVKVFNRSMKSLAKFTFTWVAAEDSHAAYHPAGERRTRAGRERNMRVPGIRIEEIQAA